MESTEKRHYEIEGMWAEERFDEGNQNRFRITAEAIPAEVRTLADIGCGNGLFLRYLTASPRSFDRLVGVDRSETALKQVETEKQVASIDALPFADGEFDLTTSFEVLEHLPVSVFQAARSELARVSRRFIMVSVPYAQDLEESFVECRACRTKFNPYHHVRSFNEAVMRDLFSDFGYTCRKLEKIESITHLKYRSLLHLFVGERYASTSPFGFPIACPMCDSEIPGSRRTNGGEASRNAPARRGLKARLKGLWPSETRARWILGVYEKGKGGEISA